MQCFEKADFIIWRIKYVFISVEMSVWLNFYKSGLIVNIISLHIATGFLIFIFDVICQIISLSEMWIAL